jgi:hypothetical protein
MSAGLVWATCTIIKNRVYGKLKDVSVDGIGETTALVRWRLVAAGNYDPMVAGGGLTARTG